MTMKFICPQKSTAGFTLVEILTVLGIIALFLTVGLARYNDFNRRQILTQAVADLKSDLRLAQDKALAGEKDCSVCQVGSGCGDSDDRKLDGWYLRFPTSGSYQIYGVCEGNQFSVKTVSLTAKAVMVTFPSSFPVTIRFRPLGQGVDGSATITLRGPAGNSESVTVSLSGGIK